MILSEFEYVYVPFAFPPWVLTTVVVVLTANVFVVGAIALAVARRSRRRAAADSS